MIIDPDLERRLHDITAEAHNSMYMQIIAEYQRGASRWDTIKALIGLGMSLDAAMEDINLREGENGNDNGC